MSGGDPEIGTCAACGGTAMSPLLSLGETPLADQLRPADTDPSSDRRWPLDVVTCRECGLPQLASQPPPEVLFHDDYRYMSSVSSSWRIRAQELAAHLIRRLGLDRESLVVEVASNDGGQLRPFAARGVEVLGVDPAPIPAARAREAGVDTLEAFFDEDLAQRILTERGPADLVLAANVLAHVPRPLGLLAGAAHLLAPGGLVCVDVGYLGAMVEEGFFDTIYHQHRCYFSLHALERLAERAGLVVVSAERLPTQGGSLRVLLAGEGEADESVQALRDAEARMDLRSEACLRGYVETVGRRIQEVRAAVEACLDDVSRVGAYGAAAKGSTLLAACGLECAPLAWVVDKSPAKQGLRLPGTAFRVVAPGHLDRDPVDVLLLLAWNLADEILPELGGFRRRGGKVLVPLPEPRLV